MAHMLRVLSVLKLNQYLPVSSALWLTPAALL